ncbi:transposable element Tcb2 transposase [Trichonephila clavipes]|nr:transposable element Tcb2 transposase [Trichonephila clavipes]
MSFTQRPASGRPRQTSLREDRHIVRNAHVQPNASSAAIQVHVETSLEAHVSSRTIRRSLAKGHLGSLHPLSVVHLRRPPMDKSIWQWCHARGNWNAAEWNQVIFSGESRLNLSSDDNLVRVWRQRCERLNPAFVLQ